MPKNTVQSRFMRASPKCTLKLLSCIKKKCKVIFKKQNLVWGKNDFGLYKITSQLSIQSINLILVEKLSVYQHLIFQPYTQKYLMRNICSIKYNK